MRNPSHELRGSRRQNRLRPSRVRHWRSGCSSLDPAACDEPVFILRAQDILAPRVVVGWAHPGEQAGTAQDKARGALVVAKQMADGQANNPHRVKVPD